MELSSLPLPDDVLILIRALESLQREGRAVEARAMSARIANALVNSQPILAALLLSHRNGWSGVTIAMESSNWDVEPNETRVLGLVVARTTKTTVRSRRRAVTYRFR